MVPYTSMMSRTNNMVQAADSVVNFETVMANG
jgi:hypothetical protein